MPRRRVTGHPADDSTDPQGFGVMLQRYIEAITILKHTPASVRARRYQLRRFIAWAAERDLTRPTEITRAHLELYQRHLHHRRQKGGQPLSIACQRTETFGVVAFFRWLAKQHWILFNPASEIELPRQGQRLPKGVLSITEAEQVLTAVDLDLPLGVRDRAIVETLYSTGIRRTELTRLTLHDLNCERGTLAVRYGKGRKQRMVPIGERATAWIKKYLEELRPELLRRADENPPPAEIFLNCKGKPLSPDAVTSQVHSVIKKVGLSDRGCCHLFRHTAATLMLEGGADIRYIQEMLGHEQLSTTEIYTRVSIQKLKAIHTATHPGAELRSEMGDGSRETRESEER